MLRKVRAALNRSPFSRVMSESALGQLAMALSLPLIARLYPAAEIGRFAIILATAQIGAIVITGRVEHSLPLLRPEARWTVGRLTILSALTFCWLPVALLLPWRPLTPSEFVASACVVAGLALYSITSYVLLSHQHFALVARQKLVNGVGTAVLQIAGGVLVGNLAALLIAYALGSIGASALALPPLRRARRRNAGASVRTLARQHDLLGFASRVAPSAIMTNTAMAIPLVAVAALYGDSSGGSFYLARRLLMIPVQFLGTSISEVGYARMASGTWAQAGRMLRRWSRKILVLAVLLLTGGLALAPAMVLFVGGGYPDISIVTALMAPAAAAQLCGTSISRALFIVRREALISWWNVARLVALAGWYGACRLWDLSFLVSVGALSAVTMTSYGILIYTTLHHLPDLGAERHDD